MTATVASVAEAAQALLETAEAALATTVGGPVAVSFLSPGTPALDHGCDTLAVWTPGIADETIGQQSPGQNTRRYGWTNLVRLNAQAARCVRVGAEFTGGGYRPPTTAQLTADAEKTMEDGWALWNGVAAAVIVGDLFDGLCEDMRFISLDPMEPQGAMAGWVLQIAVGLAGYDVEFP